MLSQTVQKLNGIDTNAIKQIADEVSRDPKQGIVKFQVATNWIDGPKSVTQIDSYELAGQKISKNFVVQIDEPTELLGSNTAPNPQEMLMAAFNACILVGYVALSSIQGIELEKLRIETEGELDLRGFLGIDPTVKPGYNEIRYTVHIKGNATPEQFQEIHKTVMATSPNFWNMANAIELKPELQIR
ncbi:MAG TPA: OsmC family protein [Leptolyngbyaceae cyanobacterium]